MDILDAAVFCLYGAALSVLYLAYVLGAAMFCIWCSKMSFSVFGMKYYMCVVFPMVLYLVYSSNTFVL